MYQQINKKAYLILLLSGFSTAICAQSATTDKLQAKYSDSFTLFFYNNTLRMLNISEDKAFDELISGIEKMKVLIVKKATTSIDYKKLTSDYRKESFEEVLTSRHEGKTFDVFVKEDKGKTKGVLVLVNDPENLFVLDIVGSIALDKVTSFYSHLDKSSEVAQKIKGYMNHDHDESDAEKEAHKHSSHH